MASLGLWGVGSPNDLGISGGQAGAKRTAQGVRCMPWLGGPLQWWRYEIAASSRAGAHSSSLHQSSYAVSKVVVVSIKSGIEPAEG